MKPQPVPKDGGRKATASGLAVIGYSAIGSDHLNGQARGSGNQDCYGRREVQNGVIAVTCDGCSDSPDSATGSRAAVRIILDVCEQLLLREPLPTPEVFAAELQSQLLVRIEASARPITNSPNATNVYYASYLFTMLVGVVTADWTALFGCGDGYYGVNGTIANVPPRKGNEPEYITYLLMDPIPDGFEDLKVKVLKMCDTLDVKSIMVATDGIEPMVKAELISGFKLSDLWNSAKYRDEEVLQALFKDVNQPPAAELGFQAQSSTQGVVFVRYVPGVTIHDDYSFVVLVRDAPGLSESWKGYRRRHALPVSKEERDATAAPATPVVVGEVPAAATTTQKGVAAVVQGVPTGVEPATSDIPIVSLVTDTRNKKKLRWWTRLFNWLRARSRETDPMGPDAADTRGRKDTFVREKGKGGGK